MHTHTNSYTHKMIKICKIFFLSLCCLFWMILDRRMREEFSILQKIHLIIFDTIEFNHKESMNEGGMEWGLGWKHRSTFIRNLRGFKTIFFSFFFLRSTETVEFGVFFVLFVMIQKSSFSYVFSLSSFGKIFEYISPAKHTNFHDPSNVIHELFLLIFLFTSLS